MANPVGSVRYPGWEKRLERYAKSQLTVQEFCEWEGVSPANFQDWRKALAAGNVAECVKHRFHSGTSECDGMKAQIDWSAFLPVQVTSNFSPLPVPSPIRIRLTIGICIFLPEADAATIETANSAVGRLAHCAADTNQRLHPYQVELTW